MSSLRTLIFYATPEHNCSYLPSQKATTMFVDPKAQVDQKLYSQLSRLGFRRSGSHYYRPHCNDCRACIPVRLPVEGFVPDRSQRRTLQRNADLKVQLIDAYFSEEHYQLYERYICGRHQDGDMYPPSKDQYRSFLIDGSEYTRFAEFRLDDRLIAIAVIDTLDDGLSAIYTFYDPDYANRSLGTYAILWQIEEVRRRGEEYLYLGYWIKQCHKMAYKTKFRPIEMMVNDRWVQI